MPNTFELLKKKEIEIIKFLIEAYKKFASAEIMVNAIKSTPMINAQEKTFISRSQQVLKNIENLAIELGKKDKLNTEAIEMSFSIFQTQLGQVNMLLEALQSHQTKYIEVAIQACLSNYQKDGVAEELDIIKEYLDKHSQGFIAKDFSAEIQEAQKRIDEFQAADDKPEFIQRQNAKLKEESAAMQAKLQSMEAGLQRSNEELQRLNSQISQSNSQIVQLTNEITQKQNEKSQLHTEVQELTRQKAVASNPDNLALQEDRLKGIFQRLERNIEKIDVNKFPKEKEAAQQLLSNLKSHGESYLNSPREEVDKTRFQEKWSEEIAKALPVFEKKLGWFAQLLQDIKNIFVKPDVDYKAKLREATEETRADLEEFHARKPGN